MPETLPITAEPRSTQGRGAARAARRAGRIPGIVYGAGAEPVMVTVGAKELGRAIESGGFANRLCNLKISGETTRVLPREIQRDPVSDRPLHIDFLRLSADSLVTIMVPTIYVDEEESPGLTRGGVLNIVRRDIELRVRADAIPESIVISLDGLDIGDSVHISGVSLPEGAMPTIVDRDFTIATIAAPTIHVEEEVEEEEDLEGEEGIEGEEGAEGVEGAEAETPAEEAEKSKPKE